MKLTRRSFTCALFACLLIALFLWMTRGMNPQTDRQNHTGKSLTDSQSGHTSPKEIVRPARRTQAKQDTFQQASHEYTELKDFFLPPVKFEQLTLRQAVHKLLDQYYTACAKTGERPHRLKLKITGQPTGPLNLTLPNSSFTYQLQTLAALSAMKVEHTNGLLHFSAIESSGHTINKSMPVPPDFVSRVNHLTNGQASTPQADDPFRVTPSNPKENIGQQLKRVLNLDDDVVINYAAATSHLTMTTSDRDIARIQALIDAMEQSPMTQIITRQVTVELPADLKVENKGDLKALAQQEGVDIMFSPVVTARPGERAIVEITREHIQPDGQKDWTGLKYSTTISQLGFGFHSTATRNRGLRDPDTSKIHYQKTQNDTIIGRNIQILSPPTEANGKQTYTIMTHTEIDAAGKPVQRSRDTPTK